jgi:hypothetical protein
MRRLSRSIDDKPLSMLARLFKPYEKRCQVKRKKTSISYKRMAEISRQIKKLTHE